MSPSPESIGDLVRLFVRTHYRTQEQAALDLGVSPAFLSQIIRGARPPSPRILDAMGLRRVVLYLPKEANQ